MHMTLPCYRMLAENAKTIISAQEIKINKLIWVNNLSF